MKIKTLQIFRVIGLIGGTTLLVLLFIAMPLKYLANIPEAVTYVGSLHGVLFVLYILAVIFTTFVVKWSILWFLGTLIATFIPFGNYILDIYLTRYIKASKMQQSIEKPIITNM